MPLHPHSRQYTAFSDSNDVNYQFKVMPFELKNATNSFQILMFQSVLQGYLGVFCQNYLDDVMIYSSNEEEHIRHVDLILERLSLHGLTCSLEKCSFARRSVRTLVIRLHQEKIELRIPM